MSWRKNHLPLAAVQEFCEGRDVGVCPTALLPYGAGLHHRHGDFETAGGIHLLANDGAYFVEAALSQWHDAEDAGCDLLDKAAASEVFVADCLGLNRCLAGRLDVKL